MVRRCWNIGLLIPIQKKNLFFWNNGENSELKTFFFQIKKVLFRVFIKLLKVFLSSLKYMFSLHSLKLSNKY